MLHLAAFQFRPTVRELSAFSRPYSLLSPDRVLNDRDSLLLLVDGFPQVALRPLKRIALLILSHDVVAREN
jgi:hypothetical protein